MGPAGDVVAVGVTVVCGSSDEVVIDGSSILVVELRAYFYHLLEPVCVVSHYAVAAADGNFVASGDYLASESVQVGVVVIDGSSLLLLNVPVV